MDPVNEAGHYRHLFPLDVDPALPDPLDALSGEDLNQDRYEMELNQRIIW